MERLFAQAIAWVDSTTVVPILTAVVGALPGLLLYISERNKRKFAESKDTFDYIKVSQDEIIEVYDQLKEAKREMMSVEKNLHDTKTSLEECLSQKSDCDDCKEKSLRLIEEAENILSQATKTELPELLHQLEILKQKFNIHRSQK